MLLTFCLNSTWQDFHNFEALHLRNKEIGYFLWIFSFALLHYDQHVQIGILVGTRVGWFFNFLRVTLWTSLYNNGQHVQIGILVGIRVRWFLNFLRLTLRTSLYNYGQHVQIGILVGISEGCNA